MYDLQVHTIYLSKVLNVGVVLILLHSLLYALLKPSSTPLKIIEISYTNPDGGILLHSSKISVSIVLCYDRCSDSNNCSLIVLLALFILLYVSSSFTHIPPSNPCSINC